MALPLGRFLSAMAPYPCCRAEWAALSPDFMSTFNEPALRHFLSVQDLNRFTAEQLLDAAAQRLDALQARKEKTDELKGKVIGLVFFEPSTRTRVSFERAGKAMSADVIAVGTGGQSSMKKGESWIDTMANLDAMHFDIFVLRHDVSGAAAFLARRTSAAVINAGDGTHEHPTQAVLDMLALRRRIGSLEGKTLTIVGDIAHSRVARSSAILGQLLGLRIRMLGPAHLLPPEFADFGFDLFTDRAAALDGADVVMALRIQHERMNGALIPSLDAYHAQFGITHEALKACAPEVVVMHPGPANRDVEISSALLDDNERCIALAQTEAGVAARMACLAAVSMARNADRSSV
jgi:aspartate carbamoyltransferase catalytic subunit